MPTAKHCERFAIPADDPRRGLAADTGGRAVGCRPACCALPAAPAPALPACCHACPWRPVLSFSRAPPAAGHTRCRRDGVAHHLAQGRVQGHGAGRVPVAAAAVAAVPGGWVGGGMPVRGGGQRIHAQHAGAHLQAACIWSAVLVCSRRSHSPPLIPRWPPASPAAAQRMKMDGELAQAMNLTQGQVRLLCFRRCYCCRSCRSRCCCCRSHCCSAAMGGCATPSPLRLWPCRRPPPLPWRAAGAAAGGVRRRPRLPLLFGGGQGRAGAPAADRRAALGRVPPAQPQPVPALGPWVWQRHRPHQVRCLLRGWCTALQGGARGARGVRGPHTRAARTSRGACLLSHARPGQHPLATTPLPAPAAAHHPLAYPPAPQRRGAGPHGRD